MNVHVYIDVSLQVWGLWAPSGPFGTFEPTEHDKTEENKTKTLHTPAREPIDWALENASGPPWALENTTQACSGAVWALENTQKSKGQTQKKCVGVKTSRCALLRSIARQ